jgi:hypothetical protein
MLEVHEIHDPRQSQTLVNFGMHWKISDSLNFLGSVGREVGPKREDQQTAIFYLGFQVLL